MNRKKSTELNAEISTTFNNVFNNEFRIKFAFSNKSFLIMLILLLTLVFSSTVVFAADLEFISDADKTNFYNVLDSYYLSFSEENMDSYLSTQFISHLSDEELSAKKELIKSMWSEFSSGYSLDDLDSWEFIVEDNIAIVKFGLFANIMDSNYETVKSYDQSMTATFFLTNDGWKIFNIVPTSVFEFNAVVDLISNDDSDSEVDDINSLNNGSTIDYTPSRGPSCDEFGNCFKRGPSLFIHPVVCDLDISSFKDEDGFSLEDISGVNKLLGNNKIIKVSIDGDSYEFYYLFKDNVLTPVSATPDIDYLVTTDSCTLQRISDGSNPMDEYDRGKIKLSGASFRSKLVTSFVKIMIEVYSWFVPDEPFTLWIEAETGTLSDAGKYSFIGPTSRGPGELYLGTKGSFATYEFESDFEGDVHLSLMITDDGLHSDGSRDAVFNLNGNSLRYTSVSQNTSSGDSVWKWVDLGIVHLNKGLNTLIVSKPEQTSAAFILDKFVFSEEVFV